MPSDGMVPQNDSPGDHMRWDYVAPLPPMPMPFNYDALNIVADALGEGREVNGGEWESVLTLYTAEGLALIVFHALRQNGWEVTRA